MNGIPFVNNGYTKENIETITYFFNKDVLKVKEIFFKNNYVLNSMKDITSGNKENTNNITDIIDGIACGTKDSLSKLLKDIA